MTLNETLLGDSGHLEYETILCQCHVVNSLLVPRCRRQVLFKSSTGMTHEYDRENELLNLSNVDKLNIRTTIV